MREAHIVAITLEHYTPDAIREYSTAFWPSPTPTVTHTSLSCLKNPLHPGGHRQPRVRLQRAQRQRPVRRAGALPAVLGQLWG